MRVQLTRSISRSGAIVFLLLVSHEANALTVPDTGTCTNNANPCLLIANGGANYGITGFSTGGGDGIGGFASSSGSGVRGSSSSGNGVIGFTQATGTSAAAISAVPPSSNDLAFWGGGQIIVTGAASKPGGGTWANSSSDQRVKRDVQNFSQGLAEIQRVRPVTYKYNGLGGTEDNGREYVGVIAQELEKVAPAMVGSRKAKLHKTDAEVTDIKTVDESAFTYMLINAVKEQQATIKQLQTRVARLEGGHRSTLSSLFTGGLGGGLALGLLPIGLIAARRKYRRPTQS